MNAAKAVLIGAARETIEKWEKVKTGEWPWHKGCGFCGLENTSCLQAGSNPCPAVEPCDRQGGFWDREKHPPTDEEKVAMCDENIAWCEAYIEGLEG